MGGRALGARGIVACVSIALALSGCAMNPAKFEQKRLRFSDRQVCEALADAQKSGDEDFIGSVVGELDRRQLNDARCETLAAEKRKKIALGVLAALTVVAVAAASSRGGGGGGTYIQPDYGRSYAQPYTTTDYSWQWDQFLNDKGLLVWACRGEQTGQFADSSRCAGKAQIDWKWPGN
ncbi:hypothetical protein [Roseateles chitinivorans]|uniref:hypothetical protein n=1 Tax=Roseateles chitinivorans TaxID=2917965 RepID=UPI003D67AB9F